jgi:hypothetical protein
MVGKSPVKANDEQRTALESLAASRDRGEADRARAVLLTLYGWISARIAGAFGVREDTVRLWRSDFMLRGIEEHLIKVTGFIARQRELVEKVELDHAGLATSAKALLAQYEEFHAMLASERVRLFQDPSRKPGKAWEG